MKETQNEQTKLYKILLGESLWKNMEFYCLFTMYCTSVQTRKTMTSDESGMNFHKENPNSMEEHHNSDDENSNDRIDIE